MTSEQTVLDNIGRVTMVSVAWLLKSLDRSVDIYDLCSLDDCDCWSSHDDGFLSTMIAEKGSDNQMGALVNTIVTRGFRVPICVVVDDSLDGSTELVMGNGHHRLVAAILLVLDEIPVYWSDSDYMHTEHTDPRDVALADEGDYAGVDEFFGWDAL